MRLIDESLKLKYDLQGSVTNSKHITTLQGSGVPFLLISQFLHQTLVIETSCGRKELSCVRCVCAGMRRHFCSFCYINLMEKVLKVAKTFTYKSALMWQLMEIFPAHLYVYFLIFAWITCKRKIAFSDLISAFYAAFQALKAPSSDDSDWSVSSFIQYMECALRRKCMDFTCAPHSNPSKCKSEKANCITEKLEHFFCFGLFLSMFVHHIYHSI